MAPAVAATRDYFLHVLDAVDVAASPTATLAENAVGATGTIADPATTYGLTFNKTGNVGGHVKVTAGATVLCDQDLGAGAVPFDGGASPDAGGSLDAGDERPDAGGAASDGGSPGQVGGACGCAPSGLPVAAAALVLIAAWFGRRRARSMA